MPKFSDTKEMPFSCEQMYNLVADVARYPEFLPWCLSADILTADENRMRARLSIGWRMLRESFISDVRLHPPAQILVSYADGPFEYLNNRWQFSPSPGGCKIDFDVDFEFRSALLRAAMQPLFYPAVQKMMAAFEARARDLYGA
jgi:coenzyme Q-binding protein COQ10